MSLNTVRLSSFLSDFFRIVSQHSMSFPRPCLSIHENCSIYSFNRWKNNWFYSLIINLIVIWLFIKTFIEEKLFVCCYKKVYFLWIWLYKIIVDVFIYLYRVKLRFPYFNVFLINLILILRSESTIDLNIFIWILCLLWRDKITFSH